MEHVEIPGLPVPVSRIALGTWSFGGQTFGGRDEAESVRTVHAALDAGVNLVDTAPEYGRGRAEEIVGRAIAGRARVLVATKVGPDWATGVPRRDASAAWIAREAEGSLRRLRVEVIDLYQLHGTDEATPAEETARALEDLVLAGKVRALGLVDPDAAAMGRLHAAAPIAAAQAPYNFFEREVEAEVLPWCRAHGVATLAYGGLCRGLLSGRLSPETTFEHDGLRHDDPKFRPPRFHAYLAAVAALDAFAREAFGRTVLELALRWLLDRPGVSVALWGARRPAQLDPLARVLGWRLEADAMARIDEIVRAHVPDPEGRGVEAPAP
jgi:aryl-alcohol dehydrogenase-like predicted oxidoreductase